MAPSGTIAGSQQHIAQAAEQLVQAVRATGQGPNDFAKALLDLIEVLAKVAEFDEMAAAANVEAESDEAKQWQEISLLTLKFCREGLIDEQQRAIKKVCSFAEQGACLFDNLTIKEPPADVDKVASAAVVANPAPLTPPGVWAKKPPPGLAAPPGLSAPPGLPAPPGLEVCTNVKDQKAKAGGKTKENQKSTSQQTRPLPPWRKETREPAAKEAEPVVAEPAVAEPTVAAGWCGLNLDAYSDGDDSSVET